MPIKGTTSSPFAIHYSNPKIITKLSIPFLPNHILNYIYILHQRSQLQTTRATKLTDMFVESHYLGQALAAGNQQKLFPIIHHPPKLQTKYVTTTAPPPHATIIVDAPIKHAAPPPVMMVMAPSTYCAPMSEHTIPAPDNKNNKRSINPNSEYYSCYKNPQELDKAKNKPTSPAAPDVPKPKVVDLLELHEVDANIIKSLKYTTLRFVHNGPFTRIYLVKNDNGVEFIAKVESKEERKRTLGIEAQVYKDCAGATGIPTIFQCCEVDGNRAIIIQKLGVDLSRIRRALPDQRFSPMDSLKVCLKTFCRIWELHNKGWLHRDIKGSNFVVGAPPDDERIYILDFGLSRPKRDRARQTGIPPIVGTSAYQSINVHSRAEYRAKDDMESWFYMCCHFITGTLPWLDSHKDWMADYKIFCKSSGRQHLVSQLPSQFDSILDIIHRSKDTVDYYKISALLKSAIAQQGQRTVEEQCAWKRDPSIIARALELPTQY